MNALRSILLLALIAAPSAAYDHPLGSHAIREAYFLGNSGPYFHHGKFTTMREAIEAHSGEALASRQAFDGMSAYDRDCIIEFLKTLQIVGPR